MLKYAQIAINIKDDYPQAYNNLGYAFQKLKKHKFAIAAYQKALAIKPDFVDAYINLGIAMRETADYLNAIFYLNKAINLSPNVAEAHNSLGSAQLEAGNVKASIESFENAIAIYNNPDYHINLAMAYFLLGRHQDGWSHYEHRKRLNRTNLCLNDPPKHRESDLDKVSANRKVIFISEQGLGDTLQFMRFLRDIKKRGINCKLCAPKKLHPLIKASDIDSSPLTPEEVSLLAPEDWFSLMSLAGYLSISEESPGDNSPYIKSEEELTSRWIKSLRKKQRLIVGLNWRGNREDIEKLKRDIPPQLLRPILKNKDATFISIQRGKSQSEDAKELFGNQNFHDAQAMIHELANSNDPQKFLEYAAVIQSCDLIITSATTTAHLAAAMGKPTWILLNKVPDWRWGLRGDTTFWYPTARLFRQQEHGNWNDVVKTVASELSNLTKDHSWIKKSDI